MTKQPVQLFTEQGARAVRRGPLVTYFQVESANLMARPGDLVKTAFRDEIRYGFVAKVGKCWRGGREISVVRIPRFLEGLLL